MASCGMARRDCIHSTLEGVTHELNLLGNKTVIQLLGGKILCKVIYLFLHHQPDALTAPLELPVPAVGVVPLQPHFLKTFSAERCGPQRKPILPSAFAIYIALVAGNKLCCSADYQKPMCPLYVSTMNDCLNIRSSINNERDQARVKNRQQTGTRHPYLTGLE